jgi:hypothetical protein
MVICCKETLIDARYCRFHPIILITTVKLCAVILVLQKKGTQIEETMLYAPLVKTHNYIKVHLRATYSK